MSNVTQISPSVDPALVEMLERLLADAKSGEIADAVVVSYRGKAGRFRVNYHVEDRWRAIGAMEWAKTAIGTDFDDTV